MEYLTSSDSPAAGRSSQTPGAFSAGADVEEQSLLSLDAIFGALRRFWYVVGFSALAGGALAWYVAGLQPLIYKKTASVMMRDSGKGKDATSTRILSELGVDEGAANLANESIILKSTSLMRRVVDTLGIGTTYWAQQRFRLVELYEASPLMAVFSGLPEQRGCEVTVTPVDDAGYTLSYLSQAGEPVALEGRYGEQLRLPFATITVQPTPRMGDEWKGRAVTIRCEAPAVATGNLLAAFSVTRPDEKDSSLLQMTLTSTNPRKAEDVLNELIEAYNSQSLEERRESSRKTQEFITNRLAELGRDLSEVDRRIVDSHTGSGIVVDADTKLSADFGSAQEMEKSIFDLQTQIKLAATLSGELDRAEKDGGLLSIDTGLADDSLSSKIETYNEAWMEYNKISQSAGSKNPIVVSLRDQMSATLRAARRALQNHRNNQQLLLRELEGKQKGLEQRLEATANRQRELTPLMREHKVKEELYMLLLTKEQENALALYIAEPSARPLETAHGSDWPIAPNTRVFTLAGAAGGGAACLLLIIGIGMLNTKVRSKHDLEGYSKLPTVGELPQLTRREKKKGIFTPGGHSTMAESLHILRNNVDNLVPRMAEGGPVILITSTIPGEGKSFITTNLAQAFAQAGRRVLIVDGDLRKGSLTRDLIGKGHRGLSTLLLRHAATPQEVIRPLPETAAGAPSIDLLPSGPLPPNPVTLLSQPLLAEMVRQLQRSYDVVILDAPPYGILADADILARTADLTLYIVRCERVDKRYFTQVQRFANEGRLPNPAYVLNDVDFKAGNYHYYGYGYGNYRYHYGQGHKAETAAEDKA